MAAVTEGTAIDGSAVLSALGGLKFQLSTNAGTYSPEKTISGYVQSIFSALDSLSNSWNSAVQFVSEYVSNFTGIPLPQSPTGETGFLGSVQYASPVSASLTGVNTTLNVRNAASASAGIVGSIAAGSVINKVLGEETSDGDKWYYIETDDGQKGYVNSNYVNLSETPQVVTTETSSENSAANTVVQQDTSSTNSFATADNDSDSSASYSYTDVSETPQSSSNGSGNGGASSSTYTNSSSSSSSYSPSSSSPSSSSSSSSSTAKNTSDGKTGLVSIKYSNSNLNVRKSPEMKDDNIIGTLDRGAVITVVKDDGKSDFVQIKLENGDTAYVAREYVSYPSDTSSISRVTTNDESGTLNVRMTPDGEVVDFLKNQASVEVLGPSEIPGWTKIKLNGEIRYIATQYIK